MTETTIIIKNTTASFTSNRNGISDIVGSKLDNAQYIALMLNGELDKTNIGSSKIDLGNILTQTGRKYRVFINGKPAITDSNGEAIRTHSALATLLIDGRENEINSDTLSYLEVEGETPVGKKFLGIFYSIADAKLYVSEQSAEGEL